MNKTTILLIVLCLTLVNSNAQLVINELSQGPTGNKEYVELLVTGSPVCGAANTVDLRGWIIDDNNSWHGTGSGAGIAGGHVRFASVSQWANVKIGTLILIYNDADISSSVASLTVDTTDSNSDCVFVVPVSSSLLEKNTTLPASAGVMTTYNVGGTIYSSTGNWTCLGMANAADAFHTVSPSNYAAAYHAIGWAMDSTSVNVYYPGSQSGNVIYMANIVDNDPFNSLNYVDSAALNHETPGAPNNSANAAWISMLNHNCQPYTSPSLSIATPAELNCANTSVVLTAITSALGLTYTWSSGASNANTDTVIQAGLYSVTVTDGSASCSASASVSVSQNVAVPDLSIFSTGFSCASVADTLTATSTTPSVTYLWSNGVSGIQNIVTQTGVYEVTATNPDNGCSAQASVNVTAAAGFNISVVGNNTTCGANNGSAIAMVTNGTADSFVWSNGTVNDTVLSLAAGTYTVTASNLAGCSATGSVTINSSGVQAPIISSDKNIMCSGDSAQICAPIGYQSYLWNTGQTGRCIYTMLAGNYYVTVTEQGNCTVSSNAIAISVRALPPVSISVNGDTLRAYNSVTYQWYYNNNPIPDATQSVLVAGQNGNYSVQVSDTNGCTALSNPVVINRTGIASANVIGDVVLYPNPVDDNVFAVEIPELIIGASLQIFTVESRLIYSQILTQTRNLIVSNLSPGTYLVRVISPEGSVLRKMIFY